MNGKALAKFLAVIALIFAAFIYFIGPLAQSINKVLTYKVVLTLFLKLKMQARIK